ncbi:MAG: hypothetical protein ACM3IH_04020, partial [Sphingobacteriales bacterium]
AMANFNSIYLFYIFIGLSAAMFAEGVYLLVYSNASYRNRRLKVMSDKTDRESVLVQLRRERGLTSGGDYRLPIVNLNQLLLQSGLSIGFGRLILVIVAGMVAIFAGVLTFDGKVSHALLATLGGGLVLPALVLWFLRSRRQKSSARNFRTATTSLFARCAPDIRCQLQSRWWRERWPIRSAPNSASSQTK